MTEDLLVTRASEFDYLIDEIGGVHPAPSAKFGAVTHRFNVVIDHTKSKPQMRLPPHIATTELLWKFVYGPSTDRTLAHHLIRAETRFLAKFAPGRIQRSLPRINSTLR